MIAINTNQEKIDRKLQIEETKKFLNSLKDKKLFSDDLIKEFSGKYSSIATERILNYHYDDCIDNFIITLNNPCIIKESSNIIKQFHEQYGNYKSILNKLIKRIKWNYQGFTDLSQLKLVDKEISLHLKSNSIKLIEKELQNNFEFIGICTFHEMISSCKQIELPEIITIEEYEKILKDQYIIFISKNAFNVITNFKNILNNNLIIFSEEEIMKNFINSIKNNLLNIGNSTENILFSLKEIIPIIRTIDESGYILDSIFKEIRTYFKQFRKDLNISLLNFLLKNKFLNFNLNEENNNNNQFSLEYHHQQQLKTWKPDPNYIKTLINPEIRSSDPINLIISQLSLNSNSSSSSTTSSSLAETYQKQIAIKLLKVETIKEIEEIVEEVEIFRIKCGDSFVTSLNIMINDIIESINKKSDNIKKTDNINMNSFKVTIISHRYWPELIEKDLNHPDFIKNHLKLIEETYSNQFNDKKIIWRPQLDEVKISLQFENGNFLFTCPIEVAILLNSFNFPIDLEEEFDLNLLIALTGISDKNILKFAIIFLLKKRILISSNQFFFKFAQFYDSNESDCVDAHLTLFSSKDSEIFADDDDDNNNLDNNFSLFQQKYWPIISNMFKTFGQISAERIQSTLKMYSKEYKEPQDLLTKFLQSRVKEGILQSTGNRIILYSIVNK